MSREIKFRAWDKKVGVMRKIKALIWEENNLIAHCPPRGHEHNEHFTVVLQGWEYQLMQHTDLKDKNGVEIYEGDIVCDQYANNYTPIFRNGTYMAYNVDYLHLTKQEPSTQFNVVWKNGCEVIGNIYENPELLKER